MAGSIAPTEVTPPVATATDLGSVEGLLVTLPQSLDIAEYFNFDRFGEVVVTADRRLTPTAEFEPGPVAIAAAQAFALDRLTIDDGRAIQNPDPAIHPGNGDEFGLDNIFRGGDTITGITGVIDQRFGLYRLQPTTYGTYTSTNRALRHPTTSAATSRSHRSTSSTTSPRSTIPARSADRAAARTAAAPTTRAN